MIVTFETLATQAATFTQTEAQTISCESAPGHCNQGSAHQRMDESTTCWITSRKIFFPDS